MHGKVWDLSNKKVIFEKWDPAAERTTENFNPFETKLSNSPVSASDGGRASAREEGERASAMGTEREGAMAGERASARDGGGRARGCALAGERAPSSPPPPPSRRTAPAASPARTGTRTPSAATPRSPS